VISTPDPTIYESDNYVSVDFETTVFSKGSALDPRNSLVLAVWEYRGERKVKWGSEFDMAELVADCEAADFIIAHNAKFELQWLERCGLDIGNAIVWDTMIAEYVIGGNRWVWHQLSLEKCAQRNFSEGKVNVISKMYKAGLCSTDIPASWLERYCIQDVMLTTRLYETQLETCLKKQLLPIVYTRCLLTPVLADVERNGMQLDSHIVASLHEQKEREYAAVQRDLDDCTGGINVNSPLQLRDYLYNTLGFSPLRRRRGKRWVDVTTPSGLLPTDAETIQKLKAETKAQQKFLALYVQSKSLYNELTKYLRKLQDCCNEVDGALTASFNQTNTQTHRLSSSGRDYGMQFQNFPRAYKPIFKARNKGWLVGECDGAQLEFRVAAHLGRDKVALRNILDPDFDAHITTASYMADRDAAEMLELHRQGDSEVGKLRQDAKSETFKPLYGGSFGTPEQVKWYKGFKELYSGIADAQQSWIDEVLEKKFLVTEWGMRYYWPNTTMDRGGYVTNTTSICNYPVQAFATAEIIPVALAAFWHRLRTSDLRMFIVNTVHDSIIVELPPEEIDAFHELAQQCLIEDVYPYLEQVYNIRLSVPLGAGVMIGEHWGSKDETVYNAKEELYI
jgi:DNA polymerase I-like protein with 3'-5' exonuclease and polymerase domains